MYTGSTAQIRTDKLSTSINTEKGVRQGDTLSQILFTATLEDIFNRTRLDRMGININGEYLCNFRFTDDIVEPEEKNNGRCHTTSNDICSRNLDTYKKAEGQTGSRSTKHGEGMLNNTRQEK